MDSYLQKIEDIQAAFEKDLANGKDFEYLKGEYLGRKAELTTFFKTLKDVPKEQKPVLGKAASALRKKIEHALSSMGGSVKKNSNSFDVTEPSVTQKQGHIHPFTHLHDDVSDIFRSMGFDVLEGDHITTDYYNFESLNIPKGHPARDAWDTFYFKDENNSEEKTLLRPHTSAMQVPYLESHEPPIRTVVIGRCFRNEATDATHEHTLNQIEGFVVDTHVSAAQMVYTIKEFLAALFDQAEIEVRLRPGFFPFVEPGYEMDYQCFGCRGEGCKICKQTGWIELMGCGMIHPKVFESAGYEKRKYTGFAFGMGFDRLAMARYQVPEIRLFNSGDLRFVKQF